MHKIISLLILPFVTTILTVTLILAEGNPIDNTSMDIMQYDINNTTNIKKFGVIGDGITDDTLAIQKAINSASSVNYRLSGC